MQASPATLINLGFAERLAIAALIGLAVGLEREASGHASGPGARFAGIRTFFLLGILGGCAGLLLSIAHTAMGATILAGGMAMCVTAYAMAARRPEMELDGTTEVAALVVLALGALAGFGPIELAAGAAAVGVLALSEKNRLHALVKHVDDTELRAALQFAVLALVILPLLPRGPLWEPLSVRPRLLWMIVLLFSGLNFAGYLARRFVGPERGYGITGLFGGLVSSTAVTIKFSRHSRSEPALAEALARGVFGACFVLIPRVLIVSAVMNAGVALALARMLLPALVVGIGTLVFLWTRRTNDVGVSPIIPSNPLQLWTAVRMALAFQGAMILISYVQAAAGSRGLYVTGVFLGLTNLDALTVSMSRAGLETAAPIAARVIAIGILASTLLKLGATLVLGTPRFRRTAASSLAVLAIGSAIGLAFV